MEKFSQYHLAYNKQQLALDGFLVHQIAKKFETPIYVYSEKILSDNYKAFENAALKAGIENYQICFALKANNNPALLKSLSKLGSGADIVSGGELLRANKSGIHPSKIVFSGVGKTQPEIELALKKEICSFNVESFEELEEINSLAKKCKIKANIAIRFNPKVMAHTHKHISTGFKTHKFGILENDILNHINKKSLWSHCKLVGLSVHIGSQILRLNELELAMNRMGHLSEKIKKPLDFLDVGGGLGIDYKVQEKAPKLQDYMNMVSKTIYQYQSKDCQIVFEPGRRIVARSGFFLTKVLRSKTSESHHFLIVDGGMNDLVRPSLYDAYHHIVPSKQSKTQIEYDVVGPICETADCFGSKRTLPPMKPGDLLMICDAGAYGYSMGSEYNMRNRPKEILLTLKNQLKDISQN